MTKHKNYTILNYEKNGKVIFNKHINTLYLIIAVTVLSAIIVLCTVLYSYDKTKDDLYKQLQNELKVEEKSLLEWRLNDEKQIR